MLKSRCRTTLAFDAAAAPLVQAAGRNGHCAADLARRPAGRRQTDAQAPIRQRGRVASRAAPHCSPLTVIHDDHDDASAAPGRRRRHASEPGRLRQTGGQAGGQARRDR